MKILTIDNFGDRGTAQLPDEGYAYVTIAPGSTLDACLVGSYALGVGGVVPFHVAVSRLPARSYRFETSGGGLPALSPGDPSYPQPTTLQACGKLELALWQACEVPVPGPRVPSYASGLLATLAAAPTTVASRILLLPFAGRRRATFFITRDAGNPIDVDCSILVRGVRYLPDFLAAARRAGAAFRPEFFDEQITSLWAGAGARPKSIATDLPPVGRTITIEDACYDELELYVYGTGAADDGSVYAVAEASGERSR